MNPFPVLGEAVSVVWWKSQYSKRLFLWHNLIDTFLWRSFYNWLSFLWRYLSDIFIFFHVFQITNFENILTSIIILSVIPQFRQKFFKRQGYNMAIFAQMALFSGNISFIIIGETIKIWNTNNKQRVEICASIFCIHLRLYSLFMIIKQRFYIYLTILSVYYIFVCRRKLKITVDAYTTRICLCENNFVGQLSG